MYIKSSHVNTNERIQFSQAVASERACDLKEEREKAVKKGDQGSMGYF